MSIILGILDEHRRVISNQEVFSMAVSTQQYANLQTKVVSAGRLAMGLQGVVTHQRSAYDTHPTIDAFGNLVSFDGRLDNWKELAATLHLDIVRTSDSEIILAAFRLWGEQSFSHLTGDWGLSLWCHATQTLFLARDHAGTRTLYFSVTGQHVVWSSHLESFGIEKKSMRLSEEYARRYLAGDRIRECTPFEGIFSVLPGQWISICGGQILQSRHWDPLRQDTIQYRTDDEYERNFLELFAQSIERRTGEGAPILAQLSGGMDSTSIVCMSDFLRKTNDPNAELLDTISYYDDSESSLDEKRYFSITETRRGKVGYHLNTAFERRTFIPVDAAYGIYPIPGADSFSLELEQELDRAIWPKGYRSVLSGIGGDEVLGGNPQGTPELADYLVSARLIQLARASISWSLIERTPLIKTLASVGRFTSRLYFQNTVSAHTAPSWCSPATNHYSQGSHRWAMPSRLDNALAWEAAMETLPHLVPPLLFRPEYRYPFLDKDLVNYLFSIPREQILRPGQRRSLMRRSLVSIVPQEILDRRQKAYQLRAPLRSLRYASEHLQSLFSDPAIARFRFVDIGRIQAAIRRLAEGISDEWQALVRTIALELWLRSLDQRTSRTTQDYIPTKEVSTSAT